MLSCSKCLSLLPEDMFSVNRRNKSTGRRNVCKACVLNYMQTRKSRDSALAKERYVKNKEAYLARCREYKAQNKDRSAEVARVYRARPEAPAKQSEFRRRYKLRNASRIKSRHKDRIKNDPGYALKFALRGRLHHAIRDGQKAGSAVRDLGCTIEELKSYLESKFQPGMTWDNWSRDGWHIDHIRPLSSFDLTDREQFLQACHYTNLQPLWAKDNLSKGAAW